MASSLNINIVLSILVVSFSLLLSQIDCTSNGFTVNLLHRDSPLSPFFRPNITQFDRIKNAFHRSISRKSAFESSVQSGYGEYLMKISLGTPPTFETLAILDTGSDLTWTQCTPCIHCYNQSLPLFNPRNSTSYRVVPCQSRRCAWSENSTCAKKNVCQYSVTYEDLSYSFGDLASDTLTFQSHTRKSVSFPKTVFGCGHRNGGFFNESESGIVGLASGAVSIINQLKQSIGGKFSYCLTQINQPNVSSKITFGSNPLLLGPNIVSTPLITKSPYTFYLLHLEGVSVGSTKILYSTVKGLNLSSIEAVREDQGNIIIDSGTTFTFLPRRMYEKLEAALVKTIKGRRMRDPDGFSKLCYQGTNGSFHPPRLVVHFTGADLELAPTSTFMEAESGLFCFTLLPSEGVGIYGNLSQMDYIVEYDLDNKKVNFKKIDCSKAKMM